MKIIFLAVVGASYGVLSAAGVFTVLVAVGLIPRFAGRTHTAKHVVLYENMVVLGTIAGAFLSIFSRYSQVAAFLHNALPGAMGLWQGLGIFLQGVLGLFSGMFIGCLALAIAEMLDSVPIFARRISFRHGVGVAVLAMALGKVCGSLIYFWTELHRTVE